MDDLTVPGQLDTILGELAKVNVRLADGDTRMNEADKARAQMNDKLDIHGLMLADQSKHLTEQDDKLDALGKTQAELVTATKANTETMNLVRDAITTAKTGKTILVWVAGTAGAISTIVGTVYATIQAFGHR